MNVDTLREAVKETERFLRAVKALKTAADGDFGMWFGCKESGTVRRASMDLTRALAQLRK
jgi:hypothetical protein